MNLLIIEYDEALKGARLSASMAKHHRDTYYLPGGGVESARQRNEATREIDGHLADVYRYLEALKVMRGGTDGKVDIRQTTVSSRVQREINCTTVM